MLICWMGVTAFLSTTLLFCVGLADGCNLRRAKRSESFWDLESFQRKPHAEDCTCGTRRDTSSNPPWNVYVHTTISSSSSPSKASVKTCTGTIINSNTVVTSHKCLILDKPKESDKRMCAGDMVKFMQDEHRSIARKDQVRVTNKMDPEASGADLIPFPVKDIWYNPIFAISSERRGYPENDAALIIVEDDFISHQNFHPICVPLYNDKMDDDANFNVQGYFYGYELNGNVTAHSPNSWNGVVLKKAGCPTIHDNREDEAELFTYKKTFCLKFVDNGKRQNEGGPLIVSGPGSTAFLLGVSTDFADTVSQTGREASTGVEYAYFSSINPVIKFIEYFATLDPKTSWCDTPEIRLKNEREGGRNGGADDKYPWDKLEKPFIRDESLDCLCGEQNTRIGGRVVGGVEATPREFGWMAVVHLYPYGKTKSDGQCGGTIINDRIILTAAHCVVVDNWIGEKEKVSIDPANVQVTLNAHLRKNDPMGMDKEVSAVLFHPGYLAARSDEERGYYDFDVALLVLKEPLEFPQGRGLRPICLPKIDEEFETVGRNAWVVGWGLTDPTDMQSVAEKLQKIEIPIAELTFCSDVATSRVTDNFLCAGTLDMYHDSAQGDSGGPLQIEDKENSQWYEVGAVSWAENVKRRSGQILTAAFYSDLQKLMPFVDYHSKRLHAKWCKSKRKEDEENSTPTPTEAPVAPAQVVEPVELTK